MSDNTPRMLTAGEREAGGDCAQCRVVIQHGESVAMCRECGALHHETCWQLHRGCGSYECASASHSLASEAAPSLVITREELRLAEPLPSTTPAAHQGGPASPERRPAWNKTAIWAFVVSLIGIPLFGLITGLVAILIACIALTAHHPHRRGLALGVAAILIGVVDVIGWSVGLSYLMHSPETAVSLEDFDIDTASFDDLPVHLADAMRANVVVQSSGRLGQQAMGSGVVLSIQNQLAYIVTNRHVVDPRYRTSVETVPDDLSSLGRVIISTLDHAALPARLEWLAPGGIDLAILSTTVRGDEVRAAHWDAQAKPRIGDKVFAVGNPHGLAWTHSSGDISQIRSRSQGGHRIRILQTTAAINPGNSGGGLYDESGALIGVNTLTGDKRVAEGLGFSIALPALLDLAPERFLPGTLNEVTADE